MFRVFLPVVLSLSLFGYSNCDFKNAAYEQVCKDAVSKGVSYAYVNTFLLSPRSAERDQKSFELFQPQKITTHHANEKRANNALAQYVPQIVAHLKRYKAVYDVAEERYGVDREVIAAILMKETRLGAIKPKHDAYTVFNTLLNQCDENTPRNKRLRAMAHKNMVEIIRYCYETQRTPQACRFASSYAGAVGIAQFMPQNFIYITPYESTQGDLNVMADAILSAGAFLKHSGGYEGLIDWSKIPDMQELEAAWYAYDFTHENASFVYANGKHKRYNCFTCNDASLDYVRGYVKRIMRYNNSSNYAVGVMRLAYDAHRLLEP